MRLEWIGAATLLVLNAIPALSAPAAPKPGQRVTVTACPYAGVTANCLMIKSADGIEYNITGLAPRPRAMERTIRLRGTITDKASMCNQGIVLERMRWTRTRQKCPN
jgi:hypothetical protein